MLTDAHRERASVRTSMGSTSVFPFPCRATLGPLGRVRAYVEGIPFATKAALGLVAFNALAMTMAAWLGSLP